MSRKVVLTCAVTGNAPFNRSHPAMPVTPVQLENVTVPGYLNGFRLLLLTYHGLKPLSPEVHRPLAEWVNGGGALVICSTSLANRAVTGTPPPTGTVGQSSPSNNSTPLLPLLVLLASCGFGIALVTARRRSAFI